jgi:hypothetical protein
MGNSFIDLIIGTIKFIVVGSYRLIFAWWLGNLLDKRAEQHLKHRVRHDLGFLFSDFAGRFVRNDKSYPGGRVVTLETGNVLLRIAHDRGEDFVDLAPQSEPREWEALALGLMAIRVNPPVTMAENLPPRPSFLALSDIAPQLKSQFAQLNEAYAAGKYQSTKQTLEMIHGLQPYGRMGVLVRREDVQTSSVPRFREI